MLAKSIAAALLAALAAAQDPHSKSVECTVVYTTAYMSLVSGACSQMACTPSCQQQIDAVRSACAEAKYNETDPITGIIAERSFMQISIQALQLMAPVDCDYRIGYENCDSAGLCSMQGIPTPSRSTNSTERELLKCVSVDPALSRQSAPMAAWHSCEGACRGEFERLVHRCSGCDAPGTDGTDRGADPAFVNFLADAGRKLVDCATGGAGRSCHEPNGCPRLPGSKHRGHDCTALKDALNSACCAGPDGAVGNGDDTCNIKNGSMPAACSHNPVCASALQHAGPYCPHTFTTDAKMLGLLLDCGGNLQQLFAAEPVDTKAPAYCAATEGHGIAMPGSYDGGSGRRLTDTAHNARGGGGSRALQEVPQDAACKLSYSAAFTATASGECSRHTCTMACQARISQFLSDCRGASFVGTDPATGMNVTRMFSNSGVQALQLLGPAGCAYHGGYQACGDQCNIVDASRALNGLGPGDDRSGHEECAVFVMGVDFHQWKGCGTPSFPPGGPWNDATQSLKDRCWARYIKYIEGCSGCTDPFIKTFLRKTAKATANTHCEDCDQPQAIADKIRQVCCSGSDGIVGNEDDPCTAQIERNVDSGAGGTAGRTHDVTWYRPDTCEVDSACQAYILEIAENGCPSLFIGNGHSGAADVGGVGLGMYVDCGGHVVDLLRRGAECQVPEPPEHGSAAVCNATIKSGERCEMTCQTGYCITGRQPQCFDGQLINTMSCQVQTVQTCTLPPNGGCDPLTTCTEKTLFERLLVQCSACPQGYFGSGRSGCYDINHCTVLRNGGCDLRTTCTDLDGGYRCSACPQGYFGDPYDGQSACKPCATVANAAADAVYSCVGPGASNVSACEDGYYKGPAGQGSDLCLKCTECTSGQYSSSSCTAQHNAVCIDCSSIAHALATAVVACTGPDDSTFISGGCALGFHRFRIGRTDVCRPCTSCESGKFTKTQCSAQADAQCQSCTPVPGAAAGATLSCSNAQDSSVDTCIRGDWLDNGHCTACTVCAEGKLESSPCSDKADRRCCTTCGTGEFQSRKCDATHDGQCTACPAVLHASAGAELTCTSRSDSRLSSCSDGFFRVRGSEAGYFSSATPDRCQACRSCPVGTYAAEACSSTTDTVCVLCTPVGDAAPNAEYSCTSVSNSHVSACASGPPVSYFRTRTENEADTCSPCSYCSPGKFEAAKCTNAKDTVCPSCTVVLHSNGTSTCTSSTDSQVQKCIQGYYRVHGKDGSSDLCTVCSTCPLGKYQTAPCSANRDARCEPCTPISHSEGLVTCTGATDSQVELCADNFWRERQQTSQSDLCHSCTICGAGRYQRTACGVGVASQDTECIPCDPGEYQPDSAQSSCIDCDAGRYLLHQGATTASSCIACGAGKYSPMVRLSDRAGCIDCDAGRWSAAIVAVSSSACIRCPAGQYVDLPGAVAQDSCISCEIGKYSQKLGSALEADCLGCEDGTTTEEKAATSSHLCVASADTKMIILVVFGLLVIAACTGVACTKKRALDPKDLQELFEAASFVGPSAADHGVVSGSFSTLVSGNE